MEISDLQKNHVLGVLTTDTPKGFWAALGGRSRATYAESFAAVSTDQFLNDEQRLSKLFQERHFKMEHLFKQVASDNGVAVSTNLIRVNRCYYTYAKRGRFSATQKYVARPDDMPKPAKFRVQLAAASRFHNARQLNLGDIPTEMLTPPEVGGIFLHGPMGNSFNERDQRVGFSWFCVPYADFSGWAVRLSLIEIMAAYEAALPERTDKAIPKLRTLPPAGEA
jgi:hypothetical protein